MITRAHQKGDAASAAVYSDCEAYRYALTREWAPGRRLLVVMLNPSTATERANDPTVERCERRARTLGFGAFRVVNLFAFRATDPRELLAATDPVGPRNDAFLHSYLPDGVAAWGAHKMASTRARGVVRAFVRSSPLWCLGVTKDGHPRHPLYVRADAPLIPWRTT